MFTKRVSARFLTVAGATALALGGMSGTQAASPQTADLTVQATVDANCTIATTAVDFGSYDPIVANLSSDKPGTGKVTLLCTNGASATVTLSQGANADSGSTDAAPLRRMKHGTTDYLSYLLYSDSGHNDVWGNTAPTGFVHTGNGTSTDLTVYGVLTAGQNKPVGAYTDTVVATVTF
jgi:spore coat protein U domain-containing protein, fimbrial subunit CupE1/2/3/6